MKRIEMPVFSGAVLLFCIAVWSPSTPAVAQMANWCPGGSDLLCGTDTEKTCTAYDSRTAQCSAWREKTLYYYYAPDGSGGGGGGGGCDPMVCME